MKSSVPPFASGALPVLGHAAEFLRKPEVLLARGQSEHGDVFSLRLPGRRVVILGGPQYSKFVFTEDDHRLSIREAYPYFRHMFSAEGYFLAENDEYHRQRDIVLPRFRARQMAGYLTVMEREAAEFASALPDNGTLDLVEAFGPLVLRIAAGCFLGTEFQARTSGFFALFRTFSEGLDPLLPGWFPAPHLVRSHRARDRLRAMVGELLEQRRRQPSAEPDFLQELADARYADGSAVLDRTKINLTLMLAWVGHETATGHLCWALIDLLQHPEELRRVREEQQHVLPDPAEPLTTSTLHQLRHLDAAAHESERLHPITTGVVRKAIQEIEYGSVLIPRGAVVILYPGLVHRNPETFPEPGRFHPGRFLEDPKAAQHLIGFGGGLHRCLGVHFAYTEIKVVLTRLLQTFDLELVDTSPRPVAGQKNKWPQSPCRVRYARRANVTPGVR